MTRLPKTANPCLNTAKRQLAAAQRIAVLTGAGVSAESGVPTFRGTQGLWRTYKPEALATPQAYARDPVLVWEWYQHRFKTVTNATPNAAHQALAELETKKQLTLVTQNVDNLHQQAGSTNILELHGNLTRCRCESCGRVMGLRPGFRVPPECGACGSRARPDVVWFGEALPEAVFSGAVNAFMHAELALIVGTSGVVEPAASLARLAKQQGAFVIEINPQLTPLSVIADCHLALGAVEGFRVLL